MTYSHTRGRLGHIAGPAFLGSCGPRDRFRPWRTAGFLLSRFHTPEWLDQWVLAALWGHSTSRLCLLSMVLED